LIDEQKNDIIRTRFILDLSKIMQPQLWSIIQQYLTNAFDQEGFSAALKTEPTVILHSILNGQTCLDYVLSVASADKCPIIVDELLRCALPESAGFYALLSSLA